MFRLGVAGYWVVIVRLGYIHRHRVMALHVMVQHVRHVRVFTLVVQWHLKSKDMLQTERMSFHFSVGRSIVTSRMAVVWSIRFAWSMISRLRGVISRLRGMVSWFWGVVSRLWGMISWFWGMISWFWGMISRFGDMIFGCNSKNVFKGSSIGRLGIARWFMTHNFRYNKRLMVKGCRVVDRCRVMDRCWMVHRGMVYWVVQGCVCLMTVHLVMLFMYSMMGSMI